MSARRASMSDAGPKLKRSREDDGTSNQVEKGEGFRDLLKKRRYDMKKLEKQITRVGNELSNSRRMLAAAEILLQTMQSSAKNVKTKYGEPHSSVARRRDGLSEAKAVVSCPGAESKKSKKNSSLKNQDGPGEINGIGPSSGAVKNSKKSSSVKIRDGLSETRAVGPSPGAVKKSKKSSFVKVRDGPIKTKAVGSSICAAVKSKKSSVKRETNSGVVSQSVARHREGLNEAKAEGPSGGAVVGKSSSAKEVTPSGITSESALISVEGKTKCIPVSARHNLTTNVRVKCENPGLSSNVRATNDIGKEKSGKAGRYPPPSAQREHVVLRENSGEAFRYTPPSARRKHVNLRTEIKSASEAQPVAFLNPLFYSCRHRRKLRTLVLSPSSDSQCATSALDGVINFWRIDVKSMHIVFRNSVDCLSPLQRHWPEDVTWHPDGQSLFAIYTADNEEAQVAIIKNDDEGKSVKFLPDKPHIKGLLNGIAFMPFSSSHFVTGGSDHMVHMWQKHCRRDDKWKPTLLHGDLHSSAVHGVAGTRKQQLVLSTGADKRVIGFDPTASRVVFRHDLYCKGMTVLPNTADFNLVMVQTGQPNKQLQLFDIRTKSELHTFGWQQENSSSQSALLSQSWSPDGLYIASGTLDPKIVLFDIRFNGREPAQTIYGHKKRVFMAVWHQTLPMLLSISSDLNIGVHKMTGL